MSLARNSAANGGYDNETLDLANDVAGCGICIRKHRRSQRRRVLPIHQLSCRLRRKTRRRAGGATGRASSGDPRRRCSGCWSTSWNTHESWGSGGSCRQTLRKLPTQSIKPIESAWSGDRKPAADGKLPPVGSTTFALPGADRNTVAFSALCNRARSQTGTVLSSTHCVGGCAVTGGNNGLESR